MDEEREKVYNQLMTKLKIEERIVKTVLVLNCVALACLVYIAYLT